MCSLLLSALESKKRTLRYLMMKSKEDGTIKRGQKLSIQVHGEGPNWILIAGGALISTLVARLGFRLNHFIQNKNSNDDTSSTKGECQLFLYCLDSITLMSDLLLTFFFTV